MSNEKINEAIRCPQVRLIDENGKQVGVVPTNEALNQARNAGLDLVEVAPQADPPVAKILDYGKYRYEQTKKEKEAKKKQRASAIHVKELWLRPVTDKHDIDIKLKKARDFLEHGDRVKFGVKFRGREMQSVEDFKPVLEEIVTELDAEIVQPVSQQGRNLIVVVGPKKGE